jgi:hypothetical protein
VKSSPTPSLALVHHEVSSTKKRTVTELLHRYSLQQSRVRRWSQFMMKSSDLEEVHSRSTFKRIHGQIPFSSMTSLFRDLFLYSIGNSLEGLAHEAWLLSVNYVLFPSFLSPRDRQLIRKSGKHLPLGKKYPTMQGWHKSFRFSAAKYQTHVIKVILEVLHLCFKKWCKRYIVMKEHHCRKWDKRRTSSRLTPQSQ